MAFVRVAVPTVSEMTETATTATVAGATVMDVTATMTTAATEISQSLCAKTRTLSKSPGWQKRKAHQ